MMKLVLISSINCDFIANRLNLIYWPNVYADECIVSAFNSKVKDIIDQFVLFRVIKTRKHDKPWFNIDCRRALTEKQAAYHLWNRNRQIHAGMTMFFIVTLLTMYIPLLNVVIIWI